MVRTDPRLRALVAALMNKADEAEKAARERGEEHEALTMLAPYRDELSQFVSD